MSAADELRAMLKIAIIVASTRPGRNGTANGQHVTNRYGQARKPLGAE
jgi:hypothetical protein